MANPRDRAVPSVPEPPWEPLAHSEVFERVDGRQVELRRQRARAAHQLRVAAKQGLGDASRAARHEGDSTEDEEGEHSPRPASTVVPPGSGRAHAPAQTPGRTSVNAAHVDPLSPMTPFQTQQADGGMFSPLPNGAASPEGGYYAVELPRPGRIQQHFAAGGRLSVEDAAAIINAAIEILKGEPNVLQLAGPITVCGDVHGQFFDLLNIFQNLGGDPDSTQYLFLGDYVDRGSFSTEIVLSLLARKILRPCSIWLLRGNHECSYLTTYFNFRSECLHKYDEATYELFLRAFDCLPLAAVVNGEFLCVHGGLSPFIRTVEDIQTINRFRDPPQRGPMCDLLWADPMEEDEEELCPDALFLHNDLRGCSYVFTHAAACDFLQRNHLSAMIRAHEAQEDGYRMYRKVPSTGMPSTICVFSAPNYCEFNNLASILLIDGRQLQLKQFHSSPQPYCLPGFINAFTWSVGFVFDKLECILADMFEATDDPNESISTDDPNGSIFTMPSPSTSSSPVPAELTASNSRRRAQQGDMSALPPPRSSQQQQLQIAATQRRMFMAAVNYLLLPRALRRRGRIIRAKVLAVTRFCWLRSHLQAKRPSPQQPATTSAVRPNDDERHSCPVSDPPSSIEATPVEATGDAESTAATPVADS
jgi:serine/threonine-protein phosphatase 2B catalytic subunit